jgi:hypothetical protein
MRESKYKLGDALDPALLGRVEKLFEGENLVEAILHAHLLVERALTSRIAEKLVRPEILKEAQWSFHQKASLYVGLYGPTKWHENWLRGLNRLRNAIAHNLEDDPEEAVRKYLPWEKEREDDDLPPRPDPMSHVRGAAGILLMFVLGGIAGWSREPRDWNSI